MRSICKSFNGVRVLQDVDFEVRKGEVHALVGGNGAGKSTLMKIMQGVYQADAGEILVDGKPIKIHSIQDAKTAGIGMVFQEFSLVPSLTVAQNIYLGDEPLGPTGLINDHEAVRQAAAVFADMEVQVNPRAEVSRLGTAYWQLTEIAKALAQQARVLIMDEPTASLAKHETEALFDLIDRLKERGIAIIYISHRMDEVYRIADRITILRDGRRLLTEPLSNVTPERIVEGIVGKKMEGQLAYQARDAATTQGVPVLEARNLNAGPRVRDVSFTVHAGEILGLAGLMGSGRTELARALFGIDRIDSGAIYIRGAKVDLSTPQRAIARWPGPDPRGPASPGTGAGPLGPRQLAAPAPGPDHPRTGAEQGRRQNALLSADQAIRRQRCRPRQARSTSLRWQPAEGRPGEMARHRTGRADPRRTDRGRRHRDQERNP
jgi:ribose transport system ATP-binding protein